MGNETPGTRRMDQGRQRGNAPRMGMPKGEPPRPVLMIMGQYLGHMDIRIFHAQKRCTPVPLLANSMEYSLLHGRVDNHRSSETGNRVVRIGLAVVGAGRVFFKNSLNSERGIAKTRTVRVVRLAIRMPAGFPEGK